MVAHPPDGCQAVHEGGEVVVWQQELAIVHGRAASGTRMKRHESAWRVRAAAVRVE